MILGGELIFNILMIKPDFVCCFHVAKYFAGAVQHQHQLSDNDTNFTNIFYVPLKKKKEKKNTRKKNN